MAKVSELHYGAGTKTDSLFSNLPKKFFENVKNLVPKKHNLPLTKMVDQMIDTRPSGVNMAGIPISSSSNTSDDEFRYFDPKLLHSSGKE